MATCGFCRRIFQSPQAVKAHLKHCARYQTDKSKKLAALGKQPKAAAMPALSPPIQPSPRIAAPDLTAPLRDFVKSMCEAMTKQDAPQTPQQKRRTILQAAKVRVIDRYGTPLGQITASLRGVAKIAIERELAPLALEEFGFEEVCELAAAIRDRLYTTAFRRQAWEADRQRVEIETRKKKELEAFGDLLRADRRKKRFMRLANQHAHARCESKAIRGWDHLVILSDVEASVEEFLTGSESVLEAYAITQKVLEARFIEVEATLDAARAKAAAQWREEVMAGLVLGAVVGLVVLSFKYPGQALTIITWIERTFGHTPGAEAAAPSPEASAPPPPAASSEARSRSTRRRKDPDAPPGPVPPCTSSIGPAQGHA